MFFKHALADGYYDGEVGVVDEPIMQTLLL